MSKFVERAQVLKAQLLMLQVEDDDTAEIKAEIKERFGDSELKEMLFSLSLDTRVLLSEFNCPPLYEEAARCPMNPSRLIHLLEKMIEVAGFRQR